MPIYNFRCACGVEYEELARFDPGGEYAGVACPACGSRDKQKIPSLVNLGLTSSKLDNFEYRAGHNMEKAKAERRAAETASHMGSSPYGVIDDLNVSGRDPFGPVV